MRFLYGVLSFGLFFNNVFGEDRTNVSNNLTDSKPDVYRALSRLDRNNDGKFDFYQRHILRRNMYEYFSADDTDFDGRFDHFCRKLKEFSELEGIEYESTAGAYLFLINDPNFNITSPSYINVTFSYREDFYLCKDDGKLEKVSTEHSDKGKLTYKSEHNNGHVKLDSVNENKPTEEQIGEFLDFQKSVDNLTRQHEEIQKEIESDKK